MPKVALPQDPRWLDFCATYAGDPVRFSTEVQGIIPSEQQIDLLVNVAPSRSRVSVASGHGTGKTTSIANIVLWHMTCFDQSVTLLTANDMDQLKSTLWKEIAIALERIRRGPHGWIAEHIELLADGTARVIGFEKTWFVESKTANDKTANKMAGRHGEWLMVIADEASSLSDNVLTTLRGALSEQHNRMLLTSQFTRNAGFFWRTHNDLSQEQGGDWVSLTFSSIDSPYVSDDALKEWWDSYDDDERNVRILGLPPGDSSKLMMNLQDARAMYERGRIIEDGESFGWVLLGDVASGEGLRDKSVAVMARVIGYGDRPPDARRVEVVAIPIHTNTIRANVLANEYRDYASPYPGITYAVDSMGLGVSVAQDLEDSGKLVYRVNWALPCFQERNKSRYMNLRAQAMHHTARAAKEGRLSFLTDEWKKVVLSQSSRIPKAWTSNARIKVPEKGGKEWEGLGSPDIWDAVCFAFLEGLTYIPSDERYDQSDGARKTAVSALEAALEAAGV
jgi:hypothetical protein